MRELEAMSRTKLKVQREDDMDNETKERFVEIVGNGSEQKAALELILDLATYCREDGGEVLKDIRASAPNGKTEAPRVIEVLPEEVGRVLGRKGETVKLLEKDSNTKIEVDKNTGRLEIYGHKEAQEQALQRILSEVTYAKEEDGTILKDQPRPKPKEDAEEQPPYKLWVKDREAGRVIGRGGETIREVMERTGADIKVQKSEDMQPGSTEREIRIFGPKEQQEQALELVLKEVTWAKNEGGVLKEPKAREERRHRKQQQKEKDKAREKDKDKDKEKDNAKDAEQDHEKDGDDGNEPGNKKNASGPHSGLWVCGTCGGDHRTKECPHTSSILGVGMHIGMQMGMQALGMQNMQMGMHMMGAPVLPMMPVGGAPNMLPGARGLRHSSSESSLSSSSGRDLSSAAVRASPTRPTRAPERAHSRGRVRTPEDARATAQPSRKRRHLQHSGEPTGGTTPLGSSMSPNRFGPSSAAPRSSGAAPSTKKDRVDSFGL